MQRPAAFVQCIHCMSLCLALPLSLLLAALPSSSLLFLLRLTCALSCAAAASQRQKLSTICLGTCVFYFALHLTTAHAALSRLLLLPSAAALSCLPLLFLQLPLRPVAFSSPPSASLAVAAAVFLFFILFSALSIFIYANKFCTGSVWPCASSTCPLTLLCCCRCSLALPPCLLPLSFFLLLPLLALLSHKDVVTTLRHCCSCCCCLLLFLFLLSANYTILHVVWLHRTHTHQCRHSV